MSDLKTKLEQAGKKAERVKTEKQTRTVKGAHLRERIEQLVNSSGLEVVKNTGFLKVLGERNRNKLLVAIKGGRIDLSGFTLSGPAVTPVSEEDAKAKHLGKVRGFINFDATDEEVLAAVSDALEVLRAPAVEPSERPAKKIKKVTAEQRAEV